MALDHRRLIRPGKKIPAKFFAFDKITLQNLANKSGTYVQKCMQWQKWVRVNQAFISLIHHI